MNKIKKSLSVLLSLVMLFTTLCFFVLPETGIEANAAVGEAISIDGKTGEHNRVDDVIITVPETIYMTPDTGASKTGQYYVNNKVDESGKVTLEVSNAVTAGKMYIYAPGATSVKYTVATVTGVAGAPTVTGAGTTQAFTSTGYFKKEDIAVSVANGLSATQDSTLKWEVTLYYGANDTKGKTYYAYTTLYAPNYHSVGATAETTTKFNARAQQRAGISGWVSGIHSSDKNQYLTFGGDSSGSQTADLAGWFINEPILNLNTVYPGSMNNSGDLISSGDPSKDALYVRGFHRSDSNYNSNKSTQLNSFLGILAVDTSRYANLKTIPNLYVGAELNNVDNNYDESGEYFRAWYTLSQGSTFQNQSDSTQPSNWTQWVNFYPNNFSKSSTAQFIVAKNGTVQSNSYSNYNTFSNALNAGVAARLYDVIDLDISTVKSSTDCYLYSMVQTRIISSGPAGSRSGYANTYTAVKLNFVDKTELRNLVLQGSSINSANYNQGWGWYIQGLENAGRVLGNPCATQTDVDNAVLRLKTTLNGGTDNTPNGLGAVTGLQKLVKFYNNDGSNTWYKDAYVTVGAAVEATVSPETPVRTGYTLLGWSETAGGTPMSPTKISIYTNEPKLYAVWQANQYVLAFDNLFDFNQFNISTGSLEINERTKTGFTVTSTSGVDANTGFSYEIPVTPGKTYEFAADVKIERAAGDAKGFDIYINTMDAEKKGELSSIVDTSNGAHKEGDQYISLTGQTANLDGAAIRFMAGETTHFIRVRFDANTAGNKITVNNIRLRCLDDGVSYVPSQVVTYDGTYNLPTPTRAGYVFAGWRDSANALYNTGDTVKITENKFLHSTWTPTEYTITLHNSVTGDDTVLKYNIESTSFDLPSADAMQEESYNFLGWEVTTAQGNWTKGTKLEDGTLNKKYGDVTITAKYDEIYYTIKWVDWNGNLLKEEQVRYGQMPTKPDTDPVKEGNEQYSYEFTGWGEITKAYEDKTYTAQYTPSVNKYTVTWENDDGTVLETDSNVEYGSRKYEYNGTTPVKNATAEYTYTFDGWTIKGDTSGKVYTSQDLKVLDIFGNVTYVAHFSATKNKYTVTWKDHNGNNISSEELEYGTPVTPEELSERTDPTGMYTYTFAGWENVATHEKVTDFTGMTVTGNVTYQATYTQTKNQYTVTFNYKDAKGADKAHTVTVDHGTLYSSITLPDYAQYYWTEADVAVTEDANQAFFHTHYKANWGTTPETITQAAVFTATYSKVENVQMDVKEYDPGDCINDGENTQICHDCGYIYSKVIEAPGHHDLEEISDTANCLDDGIKTFKCKKCDYTETKDSPAKGHSFGEATEKIYATCTTDGMESYKTCERCRLFFLATEGENSTEGKNNTASFVIPAFDHNYDEGVVTTNPTCTEDGVKTFTCQRDNSHTYTEPVSKTGHSFTQHFVANEADCFNAGNSAYKFCENCEKYFAEEEDEFSLNEKDSAAAFIIPKEEHEEGEPVQENIVASDCVTNAEYDNVWYCTKCNTKLREEHITGEPLGHKFDKQVIDAQHLKAAATCSSLAVYYYECSRANCGTIAASDEYTFEYGDYDYTNHSTTETELVNNKAATCCETGYTGDLICVACNRVVKEGSEIATNNDHSAYKQTVTSKTTVEANCITAEKWIETTTCEGCKKVTKTEEKTGSINALKHTGNTKDVTTVTAEGTCCSTEKFKTETICLDCERVISTKTGEGGYNVGNHSGGTYTGTANLVVATCKIPRSWDEVTFCSGCDTELGREKITLSVDPENHVGETYTEDKDIKEATCTTVKTWNEVTYCADCKREISRVSKTGELNPENHSGTTVRLNEKEATCKEDGYEGDLYWECCNTLHTEGNVIPKHNNHTPGEPVKENEIPATETTDGQYDSVVYCTVCETEMSRETIVYHIERTITFVLKDSKVEVKAFKGDIVTPPETPEVISADGFYHLFMHWDKKIKPVTGDETYTAIYTEPCDYTELDRLEGVLNEIVNGGVVDSQVLAIYKEDIDAAFAAIKEVNKERRFRDISEQNAVTVVTDMLDELVYTIYPDYGSTLVIEASSVLYTGRILDIKAVKMPAGNVINDAEWTSSDEDIAFFSNGKLYAIGTGTVTITAERGKLKASKVITVIEGGNTRGINFTALETVEFIIEDYYTANNTSVIYWTDDQPIRFRVNLTQAGLFDYYTVYINGVPAEMSRDGYYIIPANYGDARVTIIGEVENDNDGNSGTTAVSKWSFWEWILSFFRKIGDFFRGLFG